MGPCRKQGLLLVSLGSLLGCLSAWICAEARAWPADPQPSPDAAGEFGVVVGHFRQKRWKLAAEEAELFLAHHGSAPQAELAWFLLGDCRSRLGEFGPAANAYRSLLHRFPSSRLQDQVRLRFSRAALEAANNSCAVGQFEQADQLLAELDEQPLSDGLARDLATLQGRLALARGDWSQAARRFATACGKVTQKAEPILLAWLAESQARAGDPAAALQTLQPLVTPDSLVSVSGSVSRWAQLREVALLVQMGNLRAATERVNLLFEQDLSEQQQVQLYYWAGQLCFRDGRFRDAAGHYNAALELLTEQSSSSGEKAPSRSGLLEVPELRPAHLAQRIRFMLAESYLHQGKPQQAEQFYLQLVQSTRSPVWRAIGWLQCGTCAEQLRHPERARACYLKVLVEQPDSTYAKKARARLKHRQPR